MNLNNLNKVIPEAIVQNMVVAMNQYNINTPNRVAHFLAQTKHESANFSATKENLNYSMEGLRKVFPKYFPDDAIAKAYARQPEKIANKVYANRMGNGDEISGDGWKYAGKGYIQLTGKSNYKAFKNTVNDDVVEHPDVVATPKYAALSAAWFFTNNMLNVIADKGMTDSIVQEITKRINGGLNGITERIKYTNEIYDLVK